MYVLAPYMYVYTLLLFCKEKHTYNFYAVFVIVMCRAKSLKKELYAHTENPKSGRLDPTQSQKN